MEDREKLKELTKALAKHVPERVYLSSCLCYLRTEDERESMIKFLNENENLSKTDIEVKMLEVTRKRYSELYNI